MYDTMKNKVIGEDEVMERFGVPPSKVIEVQALIGDPTDNVPGVPGIGVKTAALLINEYGDLDTLLARAVRDHPAEAARELITFADQARLSRTLVILDTGAADLVELAGDLVRQPEAETLLSFLRRLEFSTLLRRIADGLGVEAPAGAGPRRQHSGRRRTTTTTVPGAHPAEASSPSGPSRSIRRRKARLCTSPKSARPSLPRFPSTAANTKPTPIPSGSPRCSTKRATRAMSPFAPRSLPPIRCKGSWSASHLPFARTGGLHSARPPCSR